jgi:biopolymer transport protein ExbD
MPSFHKRRDPGGEISSASMSDIAFLLLIFFLVSTIFNVEQGIPLQLPGLQSESKKINRKNMMRIVSTADGRVFVDDQPVQISAIEQMVRRRIMNNDKTIVLVETHPDTRYGVMIDVLDEVKKAKARRISLKTLGS